MALTNALLSLGFNLGKTDIADNWLPLGEDDFVTAFMGDPHSTDGHSCMARQSSEPPAPIWPRKDLPWRRPT
ncbi:MAG: hypothetical protein ACLSVD_10725 [Eggerthellaceae bacterium]